jgi:hypothetical protein
MVHTQKWTIIAKECVCVKAQNYWPTSVLLTGLMNHDLSLPFKALEIRVELQNPVKPTKLNCTIQT